MTIAITKIDPNYNLIIPSLRLKLAFVCGLFSLLVACNNDQSLDEVVENDSAAQTEVGANNAIKPASIIVDHNPDMKSILAAQPEENKERFKYRNPEKTLSFFGIEPGMAVGEVLPGKGWYSRILIPWLGPQGRLMGLNYPLDIWQNFSFIDNKKMNEMVAWPTTFPEKAKQWSDIPTPITAYNFGQIDPSQSHSLDAVLFIRALHNLVRFNIAHLDSVLQQTHAILKEDGIVGVVQHQALENRKDDWANGSSGYLKKSFVIQKFAEHGFMLIAESPVNLNPADQADEGDSVWRLLPKLSGDQKDKEQRRAIGESNRMTLKFVKIKLPPQADKHINN